jgi:hypothetical protein
VPLSVTLVFTVCARHEAAERQTVRRLIATMRIEYELQPEDWAAFAEHCALTSPTYRRAARNVAVAGSLILFLLGAFAGAAANSVIWPAAGVALALAWLWYWPRQLVRSVRENAMRQERPCLTGRHVMEALPDGLHARCDITDSLTRWAGVTDIVAASRHVFVMLGEMKGYTISKSRVDSGDIESFITAARRYRDVT